MGSFSTIQTIDGWVELIESKFSFIQLDEADDFAEIIGITSKDEIEKIRQALHLVLGRRLGVFTFEQACLKLNITPLGLTGNEFIDAAYRLSIIILAINEGWEPNWDDQDEYKWYPWFEMGNRNIIYLRPYHSRNNLGRSIMGSNMCLKSPQLAQYMGTQFYSLYQSFMLK